MLVGSLSWQGVELIVWLRGSISAKLANGRGFARPENVETSFKFRESNVVICFTKVSLFDLSDRNSKNRRRPHNKLSFPIFFQQLETFHFSSLQAGFAIG